ncbi:MAG: zinc-ribbon domain-containing protein [Gemmatimonadota bacterium]
METRNCRKCGAPIGPADQTCQKCGAPLSYAPSQSGVRCAVCGKEIDAYVETCPHCGETGYPALRPRKGKGWKGSAALGK